MFLRCIVLGKGSGEAYHDDLILHRGDALKGCGHFLVTRTPRVFSLFGEYVLPRATWYS